MIEVDNDHNATVYYGDDAKLKEVFDGRARAEKMHQIMWANVFKEMPAGDRKIFDDRLKQITKTLGVQDEIHVPFDDSNYLSDLRTSILDKIKDPDGYLAQNGMRSKAVEAQVNSFTYALICAGVFTPDDYDKGKHRGIVDAMVELANADAVDTMINAMVPGGDLSGVNDTDANSIVNMLLTASPNMQRNAAERAFHEKCKELKIDFSKEVEGFEGGITTLGNVLQTATAKIANEKMLAFIEARKKHGTEQVFDADRVSDIGGKLPKVEEKFQYFPKISKRPYRALNQTMKKMQELASLMTSGFQKTVSAGSWYKGMSAEEFENTYRLGRVNERAANLIGYYEVLAYRNPLAMKKIYAALEISTDDADAAAALLSGQTYKEPWKGEEQLREMKEWSNFVEWKNEQARMKESEWTTEDEEEGDPSSEEEITPEAGIEPEEVAPVEIMTWPDNLNETQIEEYKTAITEFEKLPPEDQKKLNAECGAEIQTYARLLKMKDKLEAFRLGNLKGLFNKKDDDALDKDIEFLRGRIQEFDGSIDVTEKLGYIRGAAALESIGGAPANYAGKENDPPLQGARTGKSQPKDAVSVVSEGFKKSFGFKGRTLDLLRITMDRPDLAEEDIEPFKKQFMSHMTKEVMNDPGRFMQEYDALVLEVEQKAQARSKGKINT
jgi:hypothetical protein